MGIRRVTAWALSFRKLFHRFLLPLTVRVLRILGFFNLYVLYRYGNLSRIWAVFSTGVQKTRRPERDRCCIEMQSVGFSFLGWKHVLHEEISSFKQKVKKGSLQYLYTFIFQLASFWDAKLLFPDVFFLFGVVGVFTPCLWHNLTENKNETP